MIQINSINKGEAFRYIGCRGKVPEGVIAEMSDECEKALLSAVKPNYVYRVFDIDANDGNKVRLHGCGFTLDGHDISAHLEGCSKAVLMACTLSAAADKIIRTAEITDMTRAFILDGMASAAVEQVCNAAEDEIFSSLTGFNRTWRFSPGYGDFPIDIQRDFLNLLNAPKQIGLCASANSLLIPRKSVTAVIGLSENELPKRKRGCGCCSMRKTCAFRKRGDRCEF